MGVVIGGSGLTDFEIVESDPEWPRIQEWIARRRPSDYVSTTFSEAEIRAAHWLQLDPDWHHGYPQPAEDTFGYLAATYDLKDYCRHCGIGLRQVRPFQMRGEPKWGRRSVMQLNWVFDEYFAKPETCKAIFQPSGIACQEVLDNRGVRLKTVVQLTIPSEALVDKQGLVGTKCPHCNRVRYLPAVRGPAPALLATPTAEAVKTDAYFGSGAAAHKRVLVSKTVADALREAKVRGVSFKPVAAR